MRFPLSCLLFILLFVFSPALAMAQTTPITLEEAIRQGLANSQRLAELDARAQAADYAVAGRHAADLPIVSAQGGYTRTNHVEEFSVPTTIGRPPQVLYPDIPDNFRTRL